MTKEFVGSKQVPSRFLAQHNSAQVKKTKQLLVHHQLVWLHFLEWLLEALYKVKYMDY